MKNTITEMKNTLEGTNSRLIDIEKQITGLKGRVVEIIDTELKKNKGWKAIKAT